LAEELGKGLQNPVHECESRTRLQIGRVAELVYATDLKSVGLISLVGSSPTPPTIKYPAVRRIFLSYNYVASRRRKSIHATAQPTSR
jgi:hypothetical protein